MCKIALQNESGSRPYRGTKQTAQNNFVGSLLVHSPTKITVIVFSVLSFYISAIVTYDFAVCLWRCMPHLCFNDFSVPLLSLPVFSSVSVFLCCLDVSPSFSHALLHFFAFLFFSFRFLITLFFPFTVCFHGFAPEYSHNAPIENSCNHHNHCGTFG